MRVHLVCRDCELEKLLPTESVAATLKDDHQQTMNHNVVYQEADDA